ncbi:2'-5' RNA ligase family protein [Mucilaginibacter sp. RCC_168]|uniref:2'-5' RNA ligase family protein n=1 Tax=Mucilaginibacter sp. RCC_168 TaxID=3239221 RepID=UPI0035257B03
MNNKDYLTVISAPEHVDKKVGLFKQECVKRIGKFPGMYAKAHITIESFRDEVHQLTLKPLLLTPFYEMVGFKVRTIPQHKLRINGFDFFKHGPNFRTIYARVDLDKTTEDWFNKVKGALRMKTRRITPHLTIARNIPVASFNKLWPYFQEMEYRDTFLADCLTILEKEVDNKNDHYKVHKTIPFSKNPLAA